MMNFVYFFQFFPLLGECLKLITRYWLETKHFFNDNSSNSPSKTPYLDLKSQTRLTRFEIFPENKMLCNKPTPLYTTQNPDLFIIYTEGIITHTGIRNRLQLLKMDNSDNMENLFLVNQFIIKRTSFSCPKLLQQICYYRL